MEKLGDIQTPLLKYFAFYYGSLGIQLLRVKWTNGWSLLNVGKNVAINLATIYALISMDIFEQFTTVMVQNKPLFGVFVNLSLRYIIPLIIILQKSHFFLFGGSITKQLDSEPFRTVFANERAAQRLLIACCLFDVIRFVVFSYFVIIKVFVQSDVIWYNIFCCVCIHLLTISQYLPCLMMLYIQLGVYKYLQGVENNMPARKAANFGEFKIIVQIRELASTTQLALELISVPVSVFFAISIINIIICTYLLLFFTQNYLLLSFPILTTCYFVYITHLNNQIQQIIERLCEQCWEKQHPSAQTPTKKPIFRRNFLVHHLAQQTTMGSRVCIREVISLYQQHFQLRLFNLTVIDRPFLLSGTLVILNYLMFMYQTTN